MDRTIGLDGASGVLLGIRHSFVVGSRCPAALRHSVSAPCAGCRRGHGCTVLSENPLSSNAPPHAAMHAVLAMLPTAAYMCDPDGRITFFNDAARALWGRTPRLNDDADRFCGSHQLLTIAGAPIAHADCWMARALHEGSDFTGGEIMIERPDGTRRAALAHVNPIHDAQGMITGGVNIVVDITEQKAAEARQAESSYRKDVFLATLAHELRNPLAPIRSALPILRKGHPDSAPLLAMVERQVDHLVRLVDDLLDASRITRGHLRLRKSWLDVGSVIAMAIETTRPRIESARHNVRVKSLPRQAWFNVDGVRLAQAVGNLLDNAAKFMPPCGTIDVVLERDGNMLDIRVRDTGPGIARDVLPLVFDLFMQDERHVDSVQAGLGVGLAMVKTLVELHGGTVSATSGGENRGSEFTIRLPVVDASPDGLAPDVDGDDASLARPRQRVLIVDDNRDAAESLAMLVELLGNEAHVTFDGHSAISAAHDFRPTLVLLDLSMPVMSGFDVARALRALPEHANLRIIALSGRNEDDSRRQTRDAGFDDHIVKPLDLPTLQSLLAGSLAA